MLSVTNGAITKSFSRGRSSENQISLCDIDFGFVMLSLRATVLAGLVPGDRVGENRFASNVILCFHVVDVLRLSSAYLRHS